MPYKPLTLENLKQVKNICFYPKDRTISMSTSLTGNKGDMLNMSLTPSVGDQGDKAMFDTNSLLLLLQIMEQITGRKFRCVTGSENHREVFQCE